MIDLNELQAAIYRCAFDGDVPGLSKAECVSILSMLREAEKDAARYRWMRDEVEQPQGEITLFDGDFHVEDIDMFIDEAMKCK